MLISNQSKLVYTVDLKLVMDDNEVQNLSVKVGDTIKIRFRYDETTLTKQGVVTAIHPDRIVESQFAGTYKTKGIIVLDCSEQYRRESYNVNISDIVEILPVYITMGDPTTDEDNSGIELAPAPDEEVLDGTGNDGIAFAAEKGWEDFGAYLRGEID